MPLVAPPTPDRACVEWLAHLPGAGSEDRPFRPIEIETGGLPVEAEELNQAPALALQVRDQLLVVDRHHFKRQDSQPMGRQPVDL